ncbi:YcbK family protein [Eubacterium maltosivorans]
MPPPQDSDSAPASTEEKAPLMATPHFAMAEYQCDCTGYCDGWPCAMAPELLEKIEALRCSFGRPVIITSGVRCAARNEEVGGVSWSFHKRGCAADLYCPGVSVGDLAAGAKDCGLNVLPYYSSGYIHVEI